MSELTENWYNTCMNTMNFIRNNGQFQYTELVNQGHTDVNPEVHYHPPVTSSYTMNTSHHSKPTLEKPLKEDTTRDGNVKSRKRKNASREQNHANGNQRNQHIMDAQHAIQQNMANTHPVTTSQINSYMMHGQNSGMQHNNIAYNYGDNSQFMNSHVAHLQEMTQLYTGLKHHGATGSWNASIPYSENQNVCQTAPDQYVRGHGYPDNNVYNQLQIGANQISDNYLSNYAVMNQPHCHASQLSSATAQHNGENASVESQVNKCSEAMTTNGTEQKVILELQTTSTPQQSASTSEMKHTPHPEHIQGKFIRGKRTLFDKNGQKLSKSTISRLKNSQNASLQASRKRPISNVEENEAQNQQTSPIWQPWK